MTGRLDFATHGRDWPHREASRFVALDGLTIHAQVMGEGPALLLLHGTGASTHSWRGLMPLLAANHTVVALDLPGHGFSGYPGMNGLSITGMAGTVRTLLDKLGIEPAAAIGHSAGAAILIRMALDGQLRPQRIISLNGALKPFGGPVGQFFAPMARMMAMWPLAAHLFAWRTRDVRVVDDILRQTGSKLDPRDVALYRRLAANPEHVSAALGMMANWDLPRLERDMPRLTTPLALVAALRDEMIHPSIAEGARKLMPHAEVLRLPGLGHLAHEEDPDRVHELIAPLLPAAAATQERRLHA
jgi:magnesium chelatase accessory protein